MREIAEDELAPLSENVMNALTTSPAFRRIGARPDIKDVERDGDRDEPAKITGPSNSLTANCRQIMSESTCRRSRPCKFRRRPGTANRCSARECQANCRTMPQPIVRQFTARKLDENAARCRRKTRALPMLGLAGQSVARRVGDTRDRRDQRQNPQSPRKRRRRRKNNLRRGFGLVQQAFRATRAFAWKATPIAREESFPLIVTGPTASVYRVRRLRNLSSRLAMRVDARAVPLTLSTVPQEIAPCDWLRTRRSLPACPPRRSARRRRRLRGRGRSPSRPF